MGCGSSKDDSGGGGARNDNPEIDAIDVPDNDPKGPPPKPPDDLKDDIYRPQDYTEIDRKAQQMARTRPTTYDALARTLTANCTTDLQKARAIFVWLFHQNIFGSFYSGIKDPHTPLGYMKLIKTRKGSYASFYALLCRAAGIPCNVVRGPSKGKTYKIGQEDIRNMEGAWCAVYLANGWRLVHPYWAYFVEKEIYEGGLPPRPATKRTSIQEFFWLTDPTKMICFCKANPDAWQLLKSKWDQKKFLHSPKLTEEYFSSGLMLPKKYNAIIHTDNGICDIEFDHNQYDDLGLDAKADFIEEMSSDRLPPGVYMKDYVVTASNSPSRKIAIVRCPVRGRYMVELFGGKAASPTARNFPKIAEFRVECADVGKNNQAFPYNPDEGYGVLPKASQFGISEITPEDGLVLVKGGQIKTFVIRSTQNLDVEGTLKHNHMNSNDLKDYVKSNSPGETVTMDVTVPHEQDLQFCLQIDVRAANSRGAHTNVANYLLLDENWKKKTAVVHPSKGLSRSEEDRIRQALIAATHKRDIDKLEKAIDEFEKNGLSDNGDLHRARQKLIELHLENLRKATRDRQLGPLEEAIKKAKTSHVSYALVDSKEMMDAETTRLQLRRLQLYMHKVLELNKATISEIHSYHRPRPLVHTVMKATFRILGEPKRKLEDWSYIQNSMRKLGRHSMISRMRRADVVHLKEPQVNDAEDHLAQTNRTLVRLTSAGAGTFYVWSHNMISEYKGEGITEPQNIWGKPDKSKKKGNMTNRSSKGNKNDGYTPRARTPDRYDNNYRSTPDRYDDRYNSSPDRYDNTGRRTPDRNNDPYARKTPDRNDTYGTTPYDSSNNNAGYNPYQTGNPGGGPPYNNTGYPNHTGANGTGPPNDTTRREPSDDWDPNRPTH